MWLSCALDTGRGRGPATKRIYVSSQSSSKRIRHDMRLPLLMLETLCLSRTVIRQQDPAAQCQWRGQQSVSISRLAGRNRRWTCRQAISARRRRSERWLQRLSPSAVRSQLAILAGLTGNIAVAVESVVGTLRRATRGAEGVCVCGVCRRGWLRAMLSPSAMCMLSHSMGGWVRRRGGRCGLALGRRLPSLAPEARPGARMTSVVRRSGPVSGSHIVRNLLRACYCQPYSCLSGRAPADQKETRPVRGCVRAGLSSRSHLSRRPLRALAAPSSAQAVSSAAWIGPQEQPQQVLLATTGLPGEYQSAPPWPHVLSPRRRQGAGPRHAPAAALDRLGRRPGLSKNDQPNEASMSSPTCSLPLLSHASHGPGLCVAPSAGCHPSSAGVNKGARGDL
ncbi:hypothetical protein BCR34DRAFT_264378 [Clohesyomyces aquaticus]|uniref:Uncharacterized protein n=1 Tax=Clohesyomyces aquaticus TaxID=1231657 RepID=A0A1Y1ZTB9_9PLEO|nr:hypothetical protein BCR34DRAFT_264378 [Clohesyomyces aquaticus]